MESAAAVRGVRAPLMEWVESGKLGVWSLKSIDAGIWYKIGVCSGCAWGAGSIDGMGGVQ